MKHDPWNREEHKEFFIVIDGEKVPVSQGIYLAYKRPAWRERKRRQVRTDKEESLEALTEHGVDLPYGEALIEDIVEDRLMLDVLLGALSRLSKEESALVRALFYEGKSERTVADETGVPQKTINNRKRRLLEKLRKFF